MIILGQILDIVGYIFISVGALFLLLGALGIVRMPDVFSRMQAGTKATTLGGLTLILGVGFVEPIYFLKVLIIAIFIVISNPNSSHALARGSIKAGIKPMGKLNDDFSKLEGSE